MSTRSTQRRARDFSSATKRKLWRFLSRTMRTSKWNQYKHICRHVLQLNQQITTYFTMYSISLVFPWYVCKWKTQIQGLNVESILDAPHFLGWTCLVNIVNTSASMADHDHLNPWMDGIRPVDSGSSHSQQVLLFPQTRGEIETALQRYYRLLSTYSCASKCFK